MHSKECYFGFDEEQKSGYLVDGPNHSVLFTSYNCLLVKGKNNFGQLGLGHFQDQKRFIHCPLMLKPNEHIKQIALGPHHSLLLTNQNRVLGSGFNYLGQLNLGDKTVRTTFQECQLELEDNETITEIEAGFSFSLLRTTQNRVIYFGEKVLQHKPNLFKAFQPTSTPQSNENMELIETFLCGL